MSSDAVIQQLQRQAQNLQRQVLDLGAQVSRAAGPYPRVFLAKRTTGKQWKEQVIESGAVADFTDGRLCTSDSDPSAINDAPGAVVLMEVADGGDTRYVQLGSSAGAVATIGSRLSSRPGRYNATVTSLFSNALGSLAIGSTITVYNAAEAGLGLWMLRMNQLVVGFVNGTDPDTNAPALLVNAPFQVTVKVTGNATGGGKYTGRVWMPPLADVPATGNVAESDLGSDPGADNALVINGPELSQGTHDLTTGTPKSKFFNGTITRVNADGKIVVNIAGFDWESCT